MKTVVLSRLFITFILFYFSSLKTGAQSISGVINSYYRVTAINTVSNTVTLNTTAGLSVDTKVLIIQMKGATINSTNTASFGDITALNNAGNYEINYICGIAGNDVLLSLQLARSYTVGALVQLVTIPVYNSVTVSGTITGQPWNSATGTGGVIALEAQTIFLNNNVDASGIGFAGGWLQDYPTSAGYDCTPAIPVPDFVLPLMPGGGPQYVSGAPKGEGIAAYMTNMEYAKGKQANGGGGANNHNAGGGGGSNYGVGGIGGARMLQPFWLCQGPDVGVGGLSLSGQGYTPANNRIYMGGGGGAGHQNNNVGLPGGIGGGIVFITANSIVGSGTALRADGARPVRSGLTDPLSSGGDGGGGGGGGGTILLNVNSVSGSIQASAAGGRGSDASRTGTTSDCAGAGGGGGGGVVWMRGGAPIANVSTVVTGGANGIGSPLSPNTSCRNLQTGATSGGNGAALTGFIPFASSMPPICEPLPLNELKSFTGKSTQSGNLLQWQMHSVENIARFELQRTADKVHYQTIAYRSNTGTLIYQASDDDIASSTNFYRLKVIRTNSNIDYSPVIKITTHNAARFQWLAMHPNPASQQVTINLFSKQNTTATIIIFKGTGQQILSQHVRLSPGYSSLPVSLHQLSAGVYWMSIECDGTRLVKTLIKK